MTSLDRAVATVLDRCLGVKPDEDVLIVSDPEKRRIAEALASGARSRRAEAVLVDMSERATHGSEPPRAVAAAMLECDVLIAPTSKSLSHTSARRAATVKGVRIATMPNATEDMLARTMSADYEAIARRARALANLLSRGTMVRITSREGTDLTLGIAGRTGLADDADLRAPGAFGNLPAGEGFIAPVEGSSRGRVVFDGSIWPLGRLGTPLTVDIQDGYAIRFEGPDAAAFEQVLEPHGRDAFAVAELGIGCNETATLTGNVLEDEKILGTIHIAFGDNHSFGGSIRVPSHQDGVVLHPTLAIDGESVVDAGRLLI